MLLSNMRLRFPSPLSIVSRLGSFGRSQSTYTNRERYWGKISPWKDVTHEQFISHRWQLNNTVMTNAKLYHFLSDTLPNVLGPTRNDHLKHIKTKDDFIKDAISALKLAPMAIRLSPHILSRVDWHNPLDDPIRRQFLPLKSGMIPDHKHMKLDSLNEEADSPVPGLVHRYPGRALFLATSICPVYCRFCTRSYAVGANTDTVAKRPQKPSRKRWEVIFNHIEQDAELKDIVLSGGDIFYLEPPQLKEIVERLLSIKHVLRIRLATKGLSVAPGRFVDTHDGWTDTLIDLSNQGRKLGKQVCLHTHINHASEITWVTEMAAQRLFENGVTVRNQSVLLKGVNDTKEALEKLITTLANINIQPYYVYQCDMVQGIEDLRTPLRQIIDLDKQLRGTLSGFMMPAFVIDLPGGGGKRLVSTYESYDPDTGEATYTAPGLPGIKGQTTYTYYDPKPAQESELAEFRLHQESALSRGETLEQFVATTSAKAVPIIELPAVPSSPKPARVPMTADQPLVGHEPASQFAQTGFKAKRAALGIPQPKRPLKTTLRPTYPYASTPNTPERAMEARA
ncbi:kama family protein [Plenodomus tracheiphilus IPT5]|uniref:Kama family protein n=1 Tax=Plenodomus tracheiphilus IPT5 TaxID=1408161 RepID=A0A6A7AYK6_9PLEO|nr:kama family protein [Plenodomus tracheiphilus IPT5]